MSDASSYFRSLWPEARSHIDTAFGEQVTISPRTRKVDDPDARPVIDPERPAMVVVGIWDDTPSDTYPQSRTMPEKSAREVNDGDVVLTIAKVRLPYAPVQGDRVIRMQTSGVFVIASVEDNGETEWLINLSARGG